MTPRLGAEPMGRKDVAGRRPRKLGDDGATPHERLGWSRHDQVRIRKARPSPAERSATLTGAAGEHFVLYQLLLRGLKAGLAPSGAPDVDLLVVDDDAGVVRGIQVKTRTVGRDGGWHMKVRHEALASPNLLYVFLDLEPEVPVSYVVPSRVVARVIRDSHAAWLARPGRGGRAHRSTDMRRLLPRYPFPVPGVPDGWLGRYREKWTLLEGA